MDQLSEEVRQESPWTMMFGDDIVICSESREQVEENPERWRFALERRGMKVSRSKTEYMCVNEREGSGTVRLQGEEVKKVHEFKYLGSTVQSNGECGKEVKKRVQAGWNGWRKVSGVLCDRKMSARIKGKVYRTVVKLAMLYGLETVSLRKRQESELAVTELKMLRFSLGVRGTAHVGRLGDKVREAKLRWFGHVQRREITVARTKSTLVLIRELLFADDSALLAHSPQEIQRIINAFSDASKKFGLKINIKKTEVLYQPNSSRTQEVDVRVDGNILNSVPEFTYLGSTVTKDGQIDAEIQRRMAKASASFGRLHQRLWNNHHVSMKVKGKIYRAVVISTLLYGAESWTVYGRHVKKLHAFMMRHLRSILKITWIDKMTNKEILDRTGLPSMEDLLIRKNLRWTGHLMRMPQDRLPKQILFSQLHVGHRKRGRPRLRYKDTIKRNLKQRNIKLESWAKLSKQRIEWRTAVT
ncbi:hypothetical protein QTP70_005908 [Hemibagrus guttatus]|uniref:Reverse transcriptase domain-containing protein n=1 Tax=Hemibagrus guttatus TaxID=175788 RepID=A0AAE0PZ20_9TELE|nr:hypothetical protein QTP70_005908 [Hemibagrus guttatus]